MTRQHNKLTKAEVASAKPAEKAFWLSDGGGLALQIDPSGGKWWRLRFQWKSKPAMMSLGVFPDVSLAAARDKRDDARRLLALSPPVDPRAVKQAQRDAEASPDTFRALADEFLGMQTAGAAKTTKRRFQVHVYPYFGDKPIAKITAAELLAVLKRIEHQGHRDTAHRVRSACSRVWKYAVGSGRAEHDIAAALQGQLAPVKLTHFAAITDPKKIGELLRAIDGYDGSPVVRAALRLAPLVFARPGELRGATWEEFDLEEGEWRIPASRTKQGREHLIPLADQAVAILDELHQLTGSETGLVFHSVRSSSRKISDNTINAALRTLGYSREQMTFHGFRAMASTRLNEMGFDADVIEAQLGHVSGSKVRRAYNHAQYLGQRRDMMHFWANYLDGLRTGKDNVIAIHSKGTG